VPGRPASADRPLQADLDQLLRFHRELHRELLQHLAGEAVDNEAHRLFLVQAALDEAIGLVVNGFVKDVMQQLPMEFAVEAQKLISISLEGSVG
jgi:hypothetical protein